MPAVDIATPEQLLTALEEIETEAIGDRDEAKADLRADTNDKQVINEMIAFMKTERFVSEHVGIVAALLGPQQTLIATSEDNVKAAEAKAAAATKAVDMAGIHMGFQARGAAGWYQGQG